MTTLQFWGTVLNYSGFSSYFGKVLVLVPVPGPDQDLFSADFHQKICAKSCLFKPRSSTVSQKVRLIFLILTLVLHFMLDPGPNPVPLRQKVALIRSSTLLQCPWSDLLKTIMWLQLIYCILTGRMSSCDCSASFLSVKQDSMKLHCNLSDWLWLIQCILSDSVYDLWFCDCSIPFPIGCDINIITFSLVDKIQ